MQTYIIMHHTDGLPWWQAASLTLGLPDWCFDTESWQAAQLASSLAERQAALLPRALIRDPIMSAEYSVLTPGSVRLQRDQQPGTGA